MTDTITNELIFETLKKLQAGQAALDSKFDEMRTGMEAMRSEINHKTGVISQTLITIQKDIRGLEREVTVLGDAIDEHTRRLDRIETKLGLELVEA